MFKKGRKVIYPVYGPGKIIDVSQEVIGKETQQYYTIEITDTNLTVSIPVSKAQEFGLRYPLTEKELKGLLKSLGAPKRPDLENTDLMITEFQTMMKSGYIEDAIEIVNYIKAVERKKEKLEKRLSAAEAELLERATNFICSEVTLVLGKSTLEKYGLEVE